MWPAGCEYSSAMNSVAKKQLGYISSMQMGKGIVDRTAGSDASTKPPLKKHTATIKHTRGKTLQHGPWQMQVLLSCRMMWQRAWQQGD